MNRRGFLGAMLGAMAAPAVVKAENLMKIFVPAEKKILTLADLAADFDGDVAMCYPTSIKVRNNGISGAHIKEADFLRTWANPKTGEEISLTKRLREGLYSSRTLVTPRRPEGRPSDLKLDLPIQRIITRLNRA